MKLTAELKRLTIQRVATTPPEFDQGGWWYPATGWGNAKEIGDGYDSYVAGAYKANGIVFACVTARQLPFSEARFLYQEMPDGNPGKLHSGAGLELLEHPWTNARTGRLLSRMEQDASLAGNFYATPVAGGSRLRRLRPDWMSTITGIPGDPQASPYELEADLLMYIYAPPGVQPVLLTPERVAHYAPIPDPDAQWRGMSWMTPVLNEITADTAMTQHKIMFLRRGATLNFAISYDKSVTANQVKNFAALFAEQHEGIANAYSTLHIGGGADPKPLSVNLKDLDYKSIQGAGETRIAAAAGVGPIMARLSEGFAGASLNEGNFTSAKYHFADTTLRPLWREAAGALEKLTTPPAGERLWVDLRDVEFLKQDRKQAAEIQQARATTINILITAGYTPDSARDAVESDDFSLLEHSGLYSVQLQKLGDVTATDPTAFPDPTTTAGKAFWMAAAAKIGRRNSSNDQTLLQQAHDAIVAAGAACAIEEGTS